MISREETNSSKDQLRIRKPSLIEIELWYKRCKYLNHQSMYDITNIDLVEDFPQKSLVKKVPHIFVKIDYY